MRDHQSNSSFSSASRRTSGARGEGLGSSSMGSHVKPSPETIMSRLAYWINQINPTRYAHINRKCAHIVHHWWAEEKSVQWQQWNWSFGNEPMEEEAGHTRIGNNRRKDNYRTAGCRQAISRSVSTSCTGHRAGRSLTAWLNRAWGGGKVLQRKTPKQQLIIVARSWKEKSVANGWGRW